MPELNPQTSGHYTGWPPSLFYMSEGRLMCLAFSIARAGTHWHLAGAVAACKVQ